MNEIIVALVGGLCVGIPSVIATIVTNRKTTSLLLYRVEQLEKKQDKHNSVLERHYKLAEEVGKLETELTDLKEFVNKVHK